MVNPTTRRRKPHEQQVLMALLDGTCASKFRQRHRPARFGITWPGWLFSARHSHCRRLHGLMQKFVLPLLTVESLPPEGGVSRRGVAVFGEFSSGDVQMD